MRERLKSDFDRQPCRFQISPAKNVRFSEDYGKPSISMGGRSAERWSCFMKQISVMTRLAGAAAERALMVKGQHRQ